MNRFAFGLFTAALLATGCQDSSGPPGSFTVTGHIDNRTGAAIPANTRILAVWGVSSGTPDYGYVFGEGIINPVFGTFQIRFDDPPPSVALNLGALGVALIIATTDASLHVGDSIRSITQPIGITGQHAVVFVQHRDTIPPGYWIDLFPDGYSVGVGVQAAPGEVFDTFKPTGRSSPILIIDDRANIEVVNWT